MLDCKFGFFYDLFEVGRLLIFRRKVRFVDDYVIEEKFRIKMYKLFFLVSKGGFLN